jgi:hypothetical protein
MAAELVRGQNHPLSQVHLEIRVAAGKPVVAVATLGDEQGRIHGVEWVAHPGTPTLPGLEVSKQAAADHRLAVDLGAIPEAVHRVSVLLALPLGGDGPARFGAVAAPFVAVTGLDGTEVASYTITGLDAESAVVALELYRRQGAWKVRAVGQGSANSSPTRACPKPPTSRAPSTKRWPTASPAPWRYPRRAPRTPTALVRRPHRPSAPRGAALRHKAPPEP